MQKKRINKNDNSIYYTCHALLDCHLWFTGEDNLDELFRLEDIVKRLKVSAKKLSRDNYYVAPIYKLLEEIKAWENDERDTLETIDNALESAFKFYMNP